MAYRNISPFSEVLEHHLYSRPLQQIVSILAEHDEETFPMDRVQSKLDIALRQILECPLPVDPIPPHVSVPTPDDYATFKDCKKALQIGAEEFCFTSIHARTLIHLAISFEEPLLLLISFLINPTPNNGTFDERIEHAKTFVRNNHPSLPSTCDLLDDILHLCQYSVSSVPFLDLVMSFPLYRQSLVESVPQIPPNATANAPAFIRQLYESPDVFNPQTTHVKIAFEVITQGMVNMAQNFHLLGTDLPTIPLILSRFTFTALDSIYLNFCYSCIVDDSVIKFEFIKGWFERIGLDELLFLKYQNGTQLGMLPKLNFNHNHYFTTQILRCVYLCGAVNILQHIIDVYRDEFVDFVNNEEDFVELFSFDGSHHSLGSLNKLDSVLFQVPEFCDAFVAAVSKYDQWKNQQIAAKRHIQFLAKFLQDDEPESPPDLEFSPEVPTLPQDATPLNPFLCLLLTADCTSLLDLVTPLVTQFPHRFDGFCIEGYLNKIPTISALNSDLKDPTQFCLGSCSNSFEKSVSFILDHVPDETTKLSQAALPRFSRELSIASPLLNNCHFFSPYLPSLTPIDLKIPISFQLPLIFILLDHDKPLARPLIEGIFQRKKKYPINLLQRLKFVSISPNDSINREKNDIYAVGTTLFAKLEQMPSILPLHLASEVSLDLIIEYYIQCLIDGDMDDIHFETVVEIKVRDGESSSLTS